MGMMQAIVFLSFVMLGYSQLSEAQMVAKIESGGKWTRQQPQLLYIFITNRPANVTHGNVTFTGPPPGIDDVYQRAVYFPNVDKISRLDLNSSMFICNALSLLICSKYDQIYWECFLRRSRCLHSVWIEYNQQLHCANWPKALSEQQFRLGLLFRHCPFELWPPVEFDVG